MPGQVPALLQCTLNILAADPQKFCQWARNNASGQSVEIR